MGKENLETRFIGDVDHHEMKVIRDDGVNRHIRFARPGSSCMHFDLITWPGYLCYAGDMGTYVFSRLDDMFEFFRTDRNYKLRDGKMLAINPQYWGEKLQAVDRGDGFMKYSSEVFHKIVNDIVDHYIKDSELSEEDSEELRAAVKEDVLDNDQCEQEAYEAARDFKHDGLEFRDFWEHDLKDYSFRFMWCCYALAWGIKKYDDAKVEVTA